VSEDDIANARWMKDTPTLQHCTGHRVLEEVPVMAFDLVYNALAIFGCQRIVEESITSGGQ
jgi:hypothetical protein